MKLVAWHAAPNETRRVPVTELSNANYIIIGLTYLENPRIIVSKSDENCRDIRYSQMKSRDHMRVIMAKLDNK